MTEEERLLQKGRMVDDLRGAKSDLGCVDHRLDSIKDALKTGIGAIERRSRWKDRKSRTLVSASFPSGSEVLDLLEKREDLDEKIKLITEQLGI